MSLSIKTVLDEGVSPLDYDKRKDLIDRLTAESSLDRLPLDEDNLLFIVTAFGNIVVFACLLKRHNAGLFNPDDHISIISACDELAEFGVLAPLDSYKNVFTKYSLSFCDHKRQTLRLLVDNAGHNTIHILSHKDIEFSDLKFLSTLWSDIEWKHNRKAVYEELKKQEVYKPTIEYLQKLLRKKRKVKLKPENVNYGSNVLPEFFNDNFKIKESKVLKGSLYSFMKLFFYKHQSGLSKPSIAELRIKRAKRSLFSLSAFEKVSWSIDDLKDA